MTTREFLAALAERGFPLKRYSLEQLHQNDLIPQPALDESRRRIYSKSDLKGTVGYLENRRALREAVARKPIRRMNQA
jgi:hypothetical protein